MTDSDRTDEPTAYEALRSRDPRFDGLFFVGVSSTGIYCRPVCPAKTPLRKNCRFFSSAAAAEKSGFRPCLRCRPELAPGNAPVDTAHRVAALLVQRIHEGESDEGEGLEEISERFGMSSRQLRRIIRGELGVSPIELLQTRRLLLAKQLLTETRLPVIDIAFASGFSSLRRFNDAFKKRYRIPPTGLRKESGEVRTAHQLSGRSKLRLVYRPPYDWVGTLAFLAGRAIEGVEKVTDDSYSRTLRIGKHFGWVMVTHDPGKNALVVEFPDSLAPVLPALLGRLKNLFDLAARPDVIASRLMEDEFLKEGVAANPGLRVPGSFDGFEIAVRAVLGQQITVKAATTLATRYATAFGGEIVTPIPGLSRLSPVAEDVIAAGVDAVASLGIVSARAACIVALARAFESGRLALDAGGDPGPVMKELVSIPGIGQWTAQYIAMRALRWPDAFPKEDIAIRKCLGGITAKEAELRSLAWSPWRSYAVLHLWKKLQQDAAKVSEASTPG